MYSARKLFNREWNDINTHKEKHFLATIAKSFRTAS